MKTEILFEEIQLSGKKPVRDFFKVIMGLFIVFLAFNLIWHKGSMNELTAVLFSGLLISAFVSIVVNVKMITQIRTDGIFVRFPPFQPSFEKYSWEDIQEVYVRDFDAMNEYSKWGVRFGTWGVKFGASGKGYILWGNKGLQIVLRNSLKILVSTQRPEEIANVLNDIRRKSGNRHSLVAE